MTFDTTAHPLPVQGDSRKQRELQRRDLGRIVVSGSWQAFSRNLVRDPRYALHAFPHFPSATSFDGEEFAIRGIALAIDDSELRAAMQAVHNDSVEDDAHLYSGA